MTPEELKKATEEKFSNGFIKNCGMELIEYSKTSCKCKIIINDDLLNPWGTVHGGLIYSLADTTGGTAAICASGSNVVTLTGNINYIGPAFKTKEIIAEANIVHCGRTTVVSDVMIKTAEGKDVAKATLTYYRIGA